MSIIKNLSSWKTICALFAMIACVLTISMIPSTSYAGTVTVNANTPTGFAAYQLVAAQAMGSDSINPSTAQFPAPEAIYDELGCRTDQLGRLEDMRDAIQKDPTAVMKTVLTYTLTHPEYGPTKTFFNDNPTELDGGYWLIAGENCAPMFIVVGESAISLDAKTLIPTMDKKVSYDTAWVKGASSGRADKVTYKLEAAIPDEFSAPPEQFSCAFNDQADETIVFEQGSVKLYADGNLIGPDKYIVEMEDHALKVTVNDINAIAPGSRVLECQYDATLLEPKTGSLGPNVNVATLYYHTPKIEGTTVPSASKVFTYNLEIKKVDKDDSSKTLEGAEFYLMNSKGKYITAKGTTADEKELLTTSELGLINFAGLSAGTYKLCEEQAPDGYSKVEDIEITITPTIVDAALENLEVSVSGGHTVSVDIASGTAYITVADPKTGSGGGGGGGGGNTPGGGGGNAPDSPFPSIPDMAKDLASRLQNLLQTGDIAPIAAIATAAVAAGVVLVVFIRRRKDQE